ncbi:MAG: PEPxxWA-CTERM sorting domain-containing protein [Sphingomicrobium sp.]
MRKFALLGIAGLLASLWVAAPAQAAIYVFDFGPTLSGQFTTSDVPTGSGFAITSVTGTFMGDAITGIVDNPFSPDLAVYIASTGVVQDTDPPGDTTLIYRFDDLLLAGDILDENGLLFTTATDVVDLFLFEGVYYADFSTLGQNGPLNELQLEGSISNVASVPEPATWAMMLVGFGATGFALRRKRRKDALALA